MAKAKKSTKKGKSNKNVVKVNFKGVEGRVLLPENDYRVRVKEVTKEEGDKAPYLKWVFETKGAKDKKYNGKNLYYNTSLSPDSLWNLRNLLEACGIEVPNSTKEIDLTELEDLELFVTVEHDTYNGKKRSNVVDFGPIDGVEEEDDEDEIEVEDDADEEEDDDEEDLDEDDADEDDEDDDDEDEEDDDDDEDDDEDEGDEDEDDEDESELTEDRIMTLGTKDLEAINKEHKLKVKLKDQKSTRAKRKAIIAALEKKGLLED